MTKLTVFYDARCGLCCAVRDWVGRQPQLVPIDCRPKPDAVDDLVVVADSGEVWSGDHAWLMVLWALADYRAWAYRLASPALLPAARMVFARVSAYRGAVCRGRVSDCGNLRDLKVSVAGSFPQSETRPPVARRG